MFSFTLSWSLDYGLAAGCEAWLCLAASLVFCIGALPLSRSLREKTLCKFVPLITA